MAEVILQCVQHLYAFAQDSCCEGMDSIKCYSHHYLTRGNSRI